MHFLIASDKWKDSLTSLEACRAIEEGILEVFPQATLQFTPVADGGDGFLEVIQFYGKWQQVACQVKNPLFQPITTFYALSDDKQTAFIEMAKASGLALLPHHQRNPCRTTSYGTGELLRHALESGAKNIFLGIGGSATNDAGIGMAAALGYRFLDENGNELLPIGENLMKIAVIDAKNIHPRLKETQVTVACDVRHVFYGEKGAAHTFAPQKGASPADVLQLDEGLKRMADIFQRQFGVDVQKVEGSGAAGGLGGGAIAFLNARLQRGATIVATVARLDEKIRQADIVITGEGKLDAQSFQGKIVGEIYQRCQALQKPLLVFCGTIDGEFSFPLLEVFSIAIAPCTLDEIRPKTHDLLKKAVRRVLHAGQLLLKK
ncbi:MAG: glycerate kinase [Flammeovirgaceae bacterium]|nr:glycerate kinase [Flammeovirgaceae bacterium]MDW8287303.1 glycerate kinase [Flammeovirgaceae bacterium]